jgi:hypothetical protein
MSDEPFKLQ